MNFSKHASGVVLVVVSAIVFSTAGLFTKGVTTDSWGVIFWRGIAAFSFTTCYMVLRGQLRSEIRAFGWPTFIVMVISAAGTAAFIPALKMTTITNVSLIYSSAPLVTAVLAWVFLAERPSLRIILASAAAFSGVCVIVAGTLGAGIALHIRGDALALWMTLMMTGTMVVYRARPDTTAALPAALSSLILLPPALIFGDPFAAPLSEMPLLVLFGLVFAVASVTLSEGARRLPPADAALLSSLETPMGPLLAFLVLAERPAVQSLFGGAIILAAVLWSQRSAPRAMPAGQPPQ